MVARQVVIGLVARGPGIDHPGENGGGLCGMHEGKTGGTQRGEADQLGRLEFHDGQEEIGRLDDRVERPTFTTGKIGGSGWKSAIALAGSLRPALGIDAGG